jgi:hypothetical protein
MLTQLGKLWKVRTNALYITPHCASKQPLLLCTCALSLDTFAQPATSCAFCTTVVASIFLHLCNVFLLSLAVAPHLRAHP